MALVPVTSVKEAFQARQWFVVVALAHRPFRAWATMICSGRIECVHPHLSDHKNYPPPGQTLKQ